MKSIDRVTFWIKGMQEGWFKDSFWVKSCLSVFRTSDPKNYIVRTDKEGYYYLDETGERVNITGAVHKPGSGKPLLDFTEIITVPAGVVPNNKEEFQTSVGNLLQNYLLTTSPFKGKVPYINKRFFPADVEKYFLPNWTRSIEDVTAEKPAQEGEVFTEEFLEFAENALHLSNYTQTVVPSVTEKSLRKNVVLDKRRKELYAQYGDQLNNPVIAAQVDAELVKIDKEYLKDDEVMGFLIAGKAFDNTRKRLNSHFGTPKGLTDEQPDFIDKPLREGVDLKKLSIYVNDSYSGSIGRGLETQEGGVLVKDALRSAANLKVSADDCGTKYGQMVDMPSSVDKCLQYLNYHYIDKGKTVKITKQNLKEIVGKRLMMRSPAYCTTKSNGYCRTCCGPNVSDYPGGIATINSIPGSAIMYIAMKSMHGGAIKTTKWSDSLFT